MLVTACLEEWLSTTEPGLSTGFPLSSVDSPVSLYLRAFSGGIQNFPDCFGISFSDWLADLRADGAFSWVSSLCKRIFGLMASDSAVSSQITLS